MLDSIVVWLLENPEVGWVVVILYLMWEIRGPKGAIHDLSKNIVNVVTVVRALARVHNDIETQEVDDYLTENGMEPADFIDNDDDREKREVIPRGDD